YRKRVRAGEFQLCIRAGDAAEFRASQWPERHERTAGGRRAYRSAQVGPVESHCARIGEVASHVEAPRQQHTMWQPGSDRAINAVVTLGHVADIRGPDDQVVHRYAKLVRFEVV